MQSFKTTKMLIDKIKADLNGRTFPHLLTSASAGTKAFLESELSLSAAKVSGNAPSLQVSVDPTPPGKASVKTIFLVSPQKSVDTHTDAEAAAFKKAFGKVCDERLGSKSQFLRLLASVGVS